MIVIWCDWKGELYAYCSRECLRRYEVWVCDPDYLFEKATWTDASFGCIWCGGDLTGGTKWLGAERHWVSDFGTVRGGSGVAG